MIKTIRKIPIEFKAIQFDGTITGMEYIKKVFAGMLTLSSSQYPPTNMVSYWKVGEFENFSYVEKGDYIIKDRNSYSVCKEKDFNNTYEIINEK